MAQKSIVSITATKMIQGATQAVREWADGKDFTLFVENILHTTGTGASNEDVIVTLVDGTQFIGQVSYADLNTGLSATSETGS